jgi:erythromycin esterase
MKHRIIEYLVTRKGFTVVAFEANWSATGAVDGYVKGGAGTAAAAGGRHCGGAAAGA